MALHNVFKILVPLLFISILVHAASSSASNTTTTNNSLKAYKKFIKDKCSSTTYPKVCYKSLSPYASKIKRNSVTLTRMSVNVALKSAKNAYSTLTKVSKGKLTHGETLVIADCRENMDDTVDLLKQSVDSLVHLNGTVTDYDKFQWDTIKTWMSAAITYESTCTDEFDEIEVRPSLQKIIKTRVSNVAWMNSVALFFVNNLYY
ncbi:hypothetical protein VNO77_35642 [Canavalia gladiata]|uniref:Pectinesterase inhibitor domain-containing protein n=1 Tax=Canavalia gladiata TaxID=3824 RepID=A0AAN9PVS4_CANGL